MTVDQIKASYPTLTELDATFDAIRQRCWRGMIEDYKRYGWCRIRWVDTCIQSAKAIGKF